MPNSIVKQFRQGGYLYRLELVRCGKANCTTCPHGPYWYLMIHLRTGRVVRKYLGKNLPTGVTDDSQD